MIPHVLYSAAHAEFADTEPLGGGKAVADYLIRMWRDRQPFELTVLSPQSVRDHEKAAGQRGNDGRISQEDPEKTEGSNHLNSRRSVPSVVSCSTSRSQPAAVAPALPALRPSTLPRLTELSAFEYARFCREFEQATTAAIRRHDPRECVVLSNDISEGPDFAALGPAGYRVVTIFHVDVVDFFCRMYLKNLIRPEWAARWRWFGALPDVLRLVFEKQYNCVRHSARLVVPSAPMKETIRRCYPWCPPEQIVVLPWGNIAGRWRYDAIPRQARDDNASSDAGGERSRPAGATYPDNEFVILTLSRLSPEKGIDRLLRAMARLEQCTPGLPVRVVIAGAPAYMRGQTYARRLRRLARALRGVAVDFPGHVTGTAKAALLGRADLFVSPSVHESYGLTIAEAQAAGCRVISHQHHGATGTVVDCGTPRALAAALAAELKRGRLPKAVRATASASPDAADRLAAVLRDVFLGRAHPAGGPP